MPRGFIKRSGEQPPRPLQARRLAFEHVIKLGAADKLAPHVVPIEHVQDGDVQVAVFAAFEEGWGGRPHSPQPLDALAGHPQVDSVVGAGMAVCRRPLPNVRELAVEWTDEETLANLPNLRTLSVQAGPGGRALDPGAVPPGVRDLHCHAERTFGSLDAIAAAMPGLERLALAGASQSSMKPLAALGQLRWLIATPGKDVGALGALERLELVKLDLESSSLSSLKPFRRWARIRELEIRGRRLKTIEGIDALASLERLRLARTGVADLGPLAGHPALAELRLDQPDRVKEWRALSLPALRRLEIELDADVLPTASLLEGCPRLEDARLNGAAMGDWRPAPAARDPLQPFALPDGAWTIFGDVTAAMGLDSNHEAEVLVRAATRAQDAALGARLEFDSEAGAFSVSGSEADVRRVAEVIRRLASERP